MGLVDRLRREAPERVLEVGDALEPRCRACLQPNTAMGTIALPGYGPEMVCVDPVACRQRAQLTGVWKVVPAW